MFSYKNLLVIVCAATIFSSVSPMAQVGTRSLPMSEEIDSDVSGMESSCDSIEISPGYYDKLMAFIKKCENRDNVLDYDDYEKLDNHMVFSCLLHCFKFHTHPGVKGYLLNLIKVYGADLTKFHCSYVLFTCAWNGDKDSVKYMIDNFLNKISIDFYECALYKTAEASFQRDDVFKLLAECKEMMAKVDRKHIEWSFYFAAKTKPAEFLDYFHDRLDVISDDCLQKTIEFIRDSFLCETKLKKLLKIQEARHGY